MHHAPICTPLGGPYEHQVCRLPTRSTGSLHQAWWAYSCPGAPANQVQSAITELICSTSMHCNGAKNITCLPTHGEPNKSPDLKVGTITSDLMPKIVDALDCPSVLLNLRVFWMRTKRVSRQGISTFWAHTIGAH